MIADVVKPVLDNGDLVLRLGLALLLGGLVGLEREVSHQPAGLRTHITLALGAALFGIISVHGFDAYARVRADSNYQIDVTRVASQVVVGVGFLGAGAILKEGASIRGLTTAASLWATAAIGLAVGVGSFAVAAFTTTALLVSLVGLRIPRRWVVRRLARGRGYAIIRLQEDAAPGPAITALLEISEVTVKGVSIRRDDGVAVVEAELVGPVGVDLATVLSPISDRQEVTGIDVV